MTVDTLLTLGGVLSGPTALCILYIFIKLRALEEQVKTLSQDSDTLRDTLNDIRSDVSYIKGKVSTYE